MPLSFKQHIENLFKNSQNFSDSNGVLFVPKILESIEKIDIELIKILKDDETAKQSFFTQIDDIYVLNQNKLIEFFTLTDYMKNGSYTAYSNKIGLIRKDNFIKKFDDVVLAFPHKDCVLEAGQTKDDDKKKETFYNEILSSDEINRLFEPKVLTNIKRYNKDGVEENCEIKENDNLIIKGNNLIVLHSLKKKFARKVKLIYIDPPYNTGSDSFGYNDNFNHSTWLTFMKNRLEVAKEFLSEDGVIFVQCDDNEQAYLKVLIDEIFGINNFVETFIWKNTDNAPTLSKKSRKDIEFIHCYERNLNKTIKYIGKESDNDDAPLLNGGNPITTLKFKKGTIKFKINDGEYEAKKYDKIELLNTLYVKNGLNENDIQLEGQFKWQQSFLDNEINEGTFFLVKTINFSIRYQRKNASNVAPHKFIDENYLSKAIGIETNEDSKKHIDMLELDFPSYPKPETLISFLIRAITKPNELVMDYHLGSGTTCAVAHKMGRRYIGIEQMDYIEDIAVERLKKVIDGEQGGISKIVNWDCGGDFVYAELKTIDTFKDAEIGALNKNMQYLPISEIEDESYKISKEEIAINKAFYGIENE